MIKSLYQKTYFHIGETKMFRFSQEEKKNTELILKSFVGIYNHALISYDAINDYIVDAMRDNIKKYLVLQDRLNKSYSKFEKKMNLNKTTEFEKNCITNQLIEIDDKKKRIQHILDMLPSDIVISLVTNFDQFLSKMLIFLFENIKDQINVIDGEAKYVDIKACDSINAVQDYYIERFIDNFFRKSHNEQIAWLDTKLKLNIKNTMPNYQDFLFLCDLRNLVVHNSTKPSAVFIKNNDINKYKEKGFKIQIDKSIEFSPQNIRFLVNTASLATTHFFSAFSQKYYCKDETMMNGIENAINSFIVEKLTNQPEFAKELLLNQLSPCFKHTSDFTYYYKINLGIAYKKCNEEKELRELLKSMDWSNCSDKFIFAKNVLLNNKDDVIDFMHKNADDDWRFNYHTWPLFYEIREKEYFKNAYYEIYGDEYTYEPTDLRITAKDLQKAEKRMKK